MVGVNVMGYNVEDVRRELLTPKKSSSYELCGDIINEIVRMRHYNNISQNDLAAMSGVRQPIIARIESGVNTPNMSTVLKLLAALGKTLYIGDLKNIELEDGADAGAGDSKAELIEKSVENLPDEQTL